MPPKNPAKGKVLPKSLGLSPSDDENGADPETSDTNSDSRLIMFLSKTISLLVVVIFIDGIRGEWDCVDTVAKRYSGYNNSACTRSLDCWPCINWAQLNVTLYLTYNFTELDKNYCRWPDPGESSGPWCYYEDDSGSIRKEYCVIDPCSVHGGCVTGNGETYRDKASYTQSGHRCFSWSKLNQYGISVSFDNDLESNYCRNPDNSSAPWCYYKPDDDIVKDYCQIDKCSSTALSQFIRHTQAYMRNLNNVFIQDAYMTEQKCAEKCLEISSFVCRSFEYRSIRPWDDKKCILSNESLFTTGMQHSPRHYPIIDLFTRIDTICDAYEDRNRLYPDECPLPVGVETGIVLDSQLSASSSYDEDHQPENARLNDPTGWMANDTEPGHWLQVSFRKRMKITGVLIQGGGDTYSWTESLSIRYSLNGNNWWNLKVYEKTGGEYVDLKDQVFTANGEPNCYAKIFFEPPIWANCIRIYPLQWFNNISLRVEVLGCMDVVCNSALGLINGQIKDSQIVASTTLDADHTGPAARLKPYGRPGHGWIPSKNKNQWIEIDLGRPIEETYIITAISTQGCEYTNKWVTRYQIKYRPRKDDTWIPYLESNGSVKSFEGNTDPKRIKLNILKPDIHASQIRIVPSTWDNGVCLKLELIGCLYSVCNTRLGLESGEISDAQISASSYYTYLPPSQARLHLETWTGSAKNQLRSCWEPRIQETNQWLQVDLLELHTVTGIITQGSGDDHDLSWLYLYTLQYLSRYESDIWKDYLTLDGAIKTFKSYADNNTPFQNNLERPFITNTIRVSPEVWEGYGPCVRLEIVGCNLHETGQICGGTRVEYKGQCIGSVGSREPDACEIFSEHSHKLKIDGYEIQDFLKINFERIGTEEYRYYRIGIEGIIDTHSSVSMAWHDRTPLVYENWLEEPIVNSTSICVLADRFLGLQWITYDCMTGNLIFATLCQFDLNECYGNQSTCDTCVNVPGSYYCSCPRGYLLHEVGGSECEAICHHKYDKEDEHNGMNMSLIQFNRTCYTTDYEEVNSATSRHSCNESSETLIHETDIQVQNIYLKKK
ncbi:uncharacterized protein [Antedon mediterranea]|uniref:uncharacterized protein n=1 Tax=Antedon mediterranea TaxID=105859 RepID=UPI003AF857AC